MNISNLVLKLKELAERGADGERELAAHKLKEVLDKYDIDLEVLDEPVEMHWVRWYQPWEERLIRQIFYMMSDGGDTWIRRSSGRRTKQVGLECTKSQFVEFQYLYDFYHELFVNDFNWFFKAFIQKHRLLNRRVRAAKVVSRTNTQLRAWMIKNGIEIPEGFLTDKVSNPVMDAERIRLAIVEHESKD